MNGTTGDGHIRHFPIDCLLDTLLKSGVFITPESEIFDLKERPGSINYAQIGSCSGCAPKGNFSKTAKTIMAKTSIV
jgi:hypothetical protein